MEELKPLSCPYCGKTKPQIYHRSGNGVLRWGERKTSEINYLWYVQCNGCKARSPMIMNGKEVAVALWNGVARELNKERLDLELIRYGIRT